MVKFADLEYLPIADAELAWRFTDERWDKLPDDVLSEIKLMYPEPSKSLIATARDLRDARTGRWPNYEEFQMIKELSLEPINSDDLPEKIEWFATIPLEPDHPVFDQHLDTRTDMTLVTKWGILIRYWSSFYYPLDTVNVFDETLAWAVLFSEGDRVAYLRRIAASDESAPLDSDIL